MGEVRVTTLTEIEPTTPSERRDTALVTMGLMTDSVRNEIKRSENPVEKALEIARNSLKQLTRDDFIDNPEEALWLLSKLKGAILALEGEKLCLVMEVRLDPQSSKSRWSLRAKEQPQKRGDEYLITSGGVGKLINVVFERYENGALAGVEVDLTKAFLSKTDSSPITQAEEGEGLHFNLEPNVVEIFKKQLARLERKLLNTAGSIEPPHIQKVVKETIGRVFNDLRTKLSLSPDQTEIPQGAIPRALEAMLNQKEADQIPIPLTARRATIEAIADHFGLQIVNTPDGYRVGEKTDFGETFDRLLRQAREKLEKEKEKEKEEMDKMEKLGLGILISADKEIQEKYKEGILDEDVSAAFEGCGGDPKKICNQLEFKRGLISLVSEVRKFLFKDGASKHLKPEDPDNLAIVLLAILFKAKANALLGRLGDRNYWNGVATATFLLAAEHLKVNKAREPSKFHIGEIPGISAHASFNLEPPYPIYAEKPYDVERIAQKTRDLLNSVYAPPPQTKK